MDEIKIRILLADDHTVVRQGLAMLLGAEAGLMVVGHAENGREAIKKVDQMKPDVVLMDISMPLLNGVEATRQIKKISPDTRVVILSMHSHDRFISELFCIGISGYLLKSSSGQEIVDAIRVVMKGGVYLSPSISRQVIDDYVCLKKKHGRGDPYKKLSDREREIFQLAAEGRTNSEISDILCISPSTVKSHRSSIMRKLRIGNNSQLIQYALSIGIIDIRSK